MKYRVAYQEYTFKVAEGESLSTPDKVSEILRKDYNPAGEEMYLLILDLKSRIIEKYLIAKGTYNIVLISPADIFTQVLKCNSQQFIIAHNHPSGDTTPSKEDIIFTKKVEKAASIMGISFIDHIIYTSDNFYSFKTNGII